MLYSCWPSANPYILKKPLALMNQSSKSSSPAPGAPQAWASCARAHAVGGPAAGGVGSAGCCAYYPMTMARVPHPLLQRIDVSPDACGGAARIKGTRVDVSTILDSLAD